MNTWKAPVGKEQVITLAQIAQDIGADRAFLSSESGGFQAGAIAACRRTNVSLTTLYELAEAAREQSPGRIAARNVRLAPALARDGVDLQCLDRG